MRLHGHFFVVLYFWSYNERAPLKKKTAHRRPSTSFFFISSSQVWWILSLRAINTGFPHLKKKPKGKGKRGFLLSNASGTKPFDEPVWWNKKRKQKMLKFTETCDARAETGFPPQRRYKRMAPLREPWSDSSRIFFLALGMPLRNPLELDPFALISSLFVPHIASWRLPLKRLGTWTSLHICHFDRQHNLVLHWLPAKRE